MIRIVEIPTRERGALCEFYCETPALYQIHGMLIAEDICICGAEGAEIYYIRACHPHLCVLSTTIEEYVNGLDLD